MRDGGDERVAQEIKRKILNADTLRRRARRMLSPTAVDHAAVAEYRAVIRRRVNIYRMRSKLLSENTLAVATRSRRDDPPHSFMRADGLDDGAMRREIVILRLMQTVQPS